MAFSESNTKSYSELLQNPKWFDKRDEILKRDEYQCRCCSKQSNLQVHHRQYHFIKKANEFKKPWEYTDRYLITLCNSCHSLGHLKLKVPVFNI
jgi:5-methylcytosine-specific restriction endonuclease McrA